MTAWTAARPVCHRPSVNVEVRSQNLPGLGTRFQIGCADGGHVSVVVQHNGLRDLYTFEPGADSPTSALQLTEDQARAVGAILSGVYVQPAALGDVSTTFGDLAVDWLTVQSTASAIGRSLRELGLVATPGVVVAAVSRAGKAIVQPDGGETVQANDKLLIAGDRTGVARAREGIVG